jgi:hypothetical protein
MGFYNMPAGCLGPSDLDHYAALRSAHEEQCVGCKLAVGECECCRQCGATPAQACEPDCGLTDYTAVPCIHGVPEDEHCEECWPDEVELPDERA